MSGSCLEAVHLLAETNVKSSMTLRLGALKERGEVYIEIGGKAEKTKKDDLAAKMSWGKQWKEPSIEMLTKSQSRIRS